MPTYISSQFDIVVDQTVSAGQTLTITNSGRTFQVVGVRMEGDGASVATVSRAEPGGATTQFATVAMAWAGLNGEAVGDVDLDSSSITTPTQEIQIAVTGSSLLRMTLECIGAPAFEMTTATA